ncbi:hypothetical protein [Parendozoicomonas sp. Alg238-R29]|uniref:hypothetical protein n=1 Tax=Parendozoicomonas sp. Alg238-R29 TaxID=2993446 RepID=UPI00248DEDBE|nr:hypothetical protein [Parendozoicomonas sp. Alg238-R29]
MPIGRIKKAGRQDIPLQIVQSTDTSKVPAFNRTLQTVQAQSSVVTKRDTDQLNSDNPQILNSRKVDSGKADELPEIAGEFQNWVVEIAETDLDSPPEVIPESLQSLSQQQMNQIVEASVVESSALLSDEPEIERANDQHIREKLDEYKDHLGGTPHYSDGKPALKRGRLVFGHAWEPVRNWIGKAITRKWPPAVFWKGLREALEQVDRVGQTYGTLSQYEFCVLTLESICHIENNLPEIERRLREGDNPGPYFAVKTGWVFHPRNSNPEILIRGIHEYLKAFRNEFAKAETNGTLKDFFGDAIRKGDICFEARNRTLQDYITGRVTHYGHSSSLEEILDELIGQFMTDWFKEHPVSELPTSVDVESWIIAQDIVGYWFYGGPGDNFTQSELSRGLLKGRKVITAKLIRKYLDFQVDEGILPE